MIHEKVYAVQWKCLLLALISATSIFCFSIDFAYSWHANLGISDNEALQIYKENPNDPQITTWKNAMQYSITEHEFCFDTSPPDKSFIESCEYLLRQDYENCISHPGILLACMDPRISQFLQQFSEFRLLELDNVTNGSNVIFNQSLIPVKGWSEYSDVNLGLSFEYPADWLVTSKSNPALEESLIEIDSPFGPPSFTIFMLIHPFDVSTVGIDEIATIALESATDNSSNFLIEPIALNKYKIDGQPSAALLVSTKNSQPPFHMFMEQIVVTFNGNKSYRLSFVDLSDSFDLQKETIDHFFNSVKFLK